MTIGTANGKRVYWNANDFTVRIHGTQIMMCGAKTLKQAKEMCERNLKNFKAE